MCGGPEVSARLGDKSLEAVVVRDNDSGGYVLTGADVARVDNGQLDELGRALLMLETSAPGVFAVGDVRSRSIKRVASAVGEGSVAGRRDPLPR